MGMGGPPDPAAEVFLGSLRPDEVLVHLAHGPLDDGGTLTAPTLTPLEPQQEVSPGCWAFSAPAVRGERSGLHGYAIRVTPATRSNRPTPPAPAPLSLVRWSD